MVNVTVHERNFAFRLVLSLHFSFAILLDERSTQRKTERKIRFISFYIHLARERRGLYGAKCKCYSQLRQESESFLSNFGARLRFHNFACLLERLPIARTKHTKNSFRDFERSIDCSLNVKSKYCRESNRFD